MATRLPQLTADQLDDDQRKLWTAITEVPRFIPAVNESGHLLGRITGQNLIIDGGSHDGILANAIWLLRADEPAAQPPK
jgi:hypothetical protein